MMKILYICTFYHYAMIFRDSMNSLEKRGHQVLAFNAVAKGTKIEDKYKPIMDEKVVHRECFRTYDRAFFHVKQWKIRKAIEKDVCVGSFDLIHSHTLFNGGWAAYQLHKKFGVPYIVSVRSTDLNVFLKIKAFRNIARTIINHASGILFLSAPYKERLLEKCFQEEERGPIAERCAVIPNGLEPYWIEHIAPAKTAVHSPLELLCVSSISRRKNLPTVLNVVERLNAEGIKTRFTVIGKVLDETIKERLDKAENVTVIPFLTKEQLIDHYRGADIFVMPSFTETFGRVYAEAITQGLPVVYTRGQGFDGLFEDGTVGYSVKADDPDEILAAVKKIRADFASISKNCVERCGRFDWDYIGEELDRFYSEAVTRSKG